LRTLARDRRTPRICACGWVAQFFCWFWFRIFAAGGVAQGVARDFLQAF